MTLTHRLKVYRFLLLNYWLGPRFSRVHGSIHTRGFLLGLGFGLFYIGLSWHLPALEKLETNSGIFVGLIPKLGPATSNPGRRLWVFSRQWNWRTWQLIEDAEGRLTEVSA